MCVRNADGQAIVHDVCAPSVVRSLSRRPVFGPRKPAPEEESRSAACHKNPRA